MMQLNYDGTHYDVEIRNQVIIIYQYSNHVYINHLLMSEFMAYSNTLTLEQQLYKKINEEKQLAVSYDPHHFDDLLIVLENDPDKNSIMNKIRSNMLHEDEFWYDGLRYKFIYPMDANYNRYKYAMIVRLHHVNDPNDLRIELIATCDADANANNVFDNRELLKKLKNSK